MKKRKETEKIFSRKKSIYNLFSRNKKKFIELRYLYNQNTFDLYNHKMAFTCFYRKKIYKIFEPDVNLDRIFLISRKSNVYNYRLEKLNLLIKTLPTFRYKRMLLILSRLFKHLNFNINIYTTSYSNLFLLKSVFSKNYNIFSNKYVNDSLFYEDFVDHENQFNNFYFFDKIYDYYCQYFFFERFNCINFNSACFEPNSNIIFNDSEDSYFNDHGVNCNNFYDFFSFRLKNIKTKNHNLAENILLFPKDRSEFIDVSMGFCSEDVEDQNLFFNKYKLINDYYILFSPYTFFNEVNSQFDYNLHIFNIYKFLNFFLINKFLINKFF